MEKSKYVSVSTKGICEIVDIKKNAFVGAVKDKEYYILKPLDNVNNMHIYLPVDTTLAIRELVSSRKANEILNTFDKLSEISVDGEEDKIKKYTEIAKKGSAEDWASLVKTLSKRKKNLPKKQINYQEQSLLSQVKDCLVCELATVLKKPKEEIEQCLEV